MTPQELEKVLSSFAHDISSPSWISIIALIASIAALAIAYFQLKSIATQIRDAKDGILDDHERSRRERTVETMKYYQEATKPEHNKIVQFLDLLPNEELINIYQGKRVTLKNEMKELACNILCGKFPNVYNNYCKTSEEKEKDSTFSHAETMHLRFITLDILNHYETCIVPWHLGIVDEKTFENQFSPLVDKRDGNFKLHKAREIIGAEKFPATEAFRQKLFPQDETEAPKTTLGGN